VSEDATGKADTDKLKEIYVFGLKLLECLSEVPATPDSLILSREWMSTFKDNVASAGSGFPAAYKFWSEELRKHFERHDGSAWRPLDGHQKEVNELSAILHKTIEGLNAAASSQARSQQGKHHDRVQHPVEASGLRLLIDLGPYVMISPPTD
jgi:hypothetical protein